jgi:hypothetical protein
MSPGLLLPFTKADLQRTGHFLWAALHPLHLCCNPTSTLESIDMPLSHHQASTVGQSYLIQLNRPTQHLLFNLCLETYP